MPTRDQRRLADDRAHARLTDLGLALLPLGSVIRFMNSGAHPDDETSAMLAGMLHGRGINLSYACSTRGEGGQNDIGTEAGADLGALRTREMERACDVLQMRMYWLSEGPDDPITDFGFSKSGVETLGRWGADRTLARMVEILRIDRPDILCPTFLDIPGQHGHHRAMTESVRLAMAAAADPNFPSNAAPWQVKKLYLPAWSGAGQAYDDDLPPPPATLTLPSGRDPVTGWTWERIGQHSRAFHRTQGMGRWPANGTEREFPLHLLESHVPAPDNDVAAGLPVSLADLDAGPANIHLAAAAKAITEIRAAFPDCAAIADAAKSALAAIRDARDVCPPEAAPDILHRLTAKEDQLGHVLRLAVGAEARARTGAQWVRPGESTPLTVELMKGDAPAAKAQLDLPQGWFATDTQLSLASDAAPTDPYRAIYDPLSPPAPALILNLGDTQARLPLELPPVALPATTASLTPETQILNLNAPGRTLSLRVSDVHPAGASPEFDLPAGWSTTETDTGHSITAPESVHPGLYTLPVKLGRSPASMVRRISYDHIDPTARSRPAALKVRVLDVSVPDARIGYIGSGNDRIGYWLAALGANVTELSPEDLDGPRLAELDTIVIGIFALRFREGLVQLMPRINEWVGSGGTLVTLYHRPWDNWDPDTVPPRRLEVGQPSLRWRVTDETAAVTQLTDHPVLSGPNPIGPTDWDGWVKERGLYFAKSWDDAYTPLLELADPNEAPHKGALLVADIGKGRHVHCALIVHIQMENLVPGAFRLMANFVAPRK
ncbi:PIG-L family deacetylase [Pseudoruegeria sp. HB172150]|uniref:PIG-L family deacetylase n=1 Tax=Pseudoruegeria sp. HB172150 TaxID=2721164 RepID=UPI0015535AA1|nr:PIG-L family deacetylase [Pseudoruegeria sp. HB172150]